MPDATKDAIELAPGAIKPAVPVAEDLAAASVETAKKALVIVGSHQFDKNDKRMVIVVEQRTVKDGEVTLKTDKYPTGADIYFRTVEDVQFPADAKEVLTLGENVFQLHFWGFCPNAPDICVGPASPAYAAANVAAQRGATEIEIVGLSAAEKERLEPFIAALPTDIVAPSTAKIILA